MSKLCCKIGSDVKSYELKDSVNTSPKLAVKIGASTKYLGLKQGTKQGELCLNFKGIVYQVQTWGIDDPTYWKGLDEPYKGVLGARQGDSSCGGVGLWILVNEENYPVVIFGRIGADRPDDWARAIWRPSVIGGTNANNFPNNFKITQEQTTHPKRLQPNIRLATLTSTFNLSDTSSSYMGFGTDAKSHVIINEVVNNLLDPTSYEGYEPYWRTTNNGSQYLSRIKGYGYGYKYINNNGVRWAIIGEKPGNEDYRLVDPFNSGVDANGFKTNDYIAYINLPAWESGDYYMYSGQYNISSSVTPDIDNYNTPYIQMYGKKDVANSANNMAQRDFYIEFPYAWGEDTNPDDYFTFSPKELLQAFLNMSQSLNKSYTDYGFVRGRNY